MLTSQLRALPVEQAQTVLNCLGKALRAGKIGNPVGWLLTMMKRARDGRLYGQPETAVTTPAPAKAPVEFTQHIERPVSPSSQTHVRSVVKDIRQRLTMAKYRNDNID
ncbi:MULTISPECIES: hypothetical protein [Xenorhabdus]|uniref:Helix-turn-helix domain protein n=1 Tax=Xenorhabdus ehlersii TaxID=290111 RepID=A0A2D0IJI0_9GAMM|nr:MULTISPECIES: hypothetical protein [Xenorhabdus]MBC8950117.1 helix-turn-helix domain protein [Xenorhabdus sp. TS4]PHM21907.1 helix-turn-helix domain protein [Xenorhabdus ehlersii]